MTCEHLEQCPFVGKRETARNPVCGGFVQLYCKDGQGHGCKRREYRLEHGTHPPEEMMPNGAMLSAM